MNTGTAFVPVNIATAGLRNYIQLASGKVETFSNGLLSATGYFAGGKVNNNWIFALGKNPLNYFSNISAGPLELHLSAVPKSYLYR